MKSIFSLLLVFLSSFVLNAQEHLLSLLQNDEEPVYSSYLFKGTKVVTGESVELVGKGVLQFIIQHRFGPLNSGIYNFYGLDNAQVRFGLDYGLNEFLSLGLGRSSASKIIDGSVKIRIKRQSKGSVVFPFSITSNSGIFLKQYRLSESQDKDFLFINQLSFVNQLLIARKVNRGLTIQLSPTLIHYNLINPVELTNNMQEHDKYALGFSARKKITNRLSVNSEYFLQLNNKIYNNVLSFGFDIETGGHVFQLHLSNSPSMVASELITKTVGEWLSGDIYFGFNISRVFTLNDI